jgi:hypothetical protein
MGTGLLSFGENEIKLAQRAFNSATEVVAGAPVIADVEDGFASNLRTEATAYRRNMIQINLYTDSLCTNHDPLPFFYAAPGQCVPDPFDERAFKMTVTGSAVTVELFTDRACQMPASSSTTVTYTTSQGSSACVASTMYSSTYMTIQLLNVAPGQLPMGYYYGTYMFLMTSRSACNAFSTSNIVNNVVGASPFSIIESSGDSPFGITYGGAMALTCSADGKGVIVHGWRTNKMNGGNLTIVGASPTTKYTVRLGGCQPLVQGSDIYFRLVCI